MTMTYETMKRRLESAIPNGFSVYFKPSFAEDESSFCVSDADNNTVASISVGEIRKLRFQGKGWSSVLVSRIPEPKNETPEVKATRRKKKKKVDVLVEEQ
jgi:hypothetical protein